MSNFLRYVPQAIQRSASPLPPNSHLGVVKSLDYNTEWGFVTNPTLIRIYGRDVFLLGVKDSDGSYLDKGDIVIFYIIAQLGRPRVKAILKVGPSRLRFLRDILLELNNAGNLHPV